MKQKIPQHIALIPDGNRRWARRRSLVPWKGHWASEKILRNFLNWCLEWGIPQVSIWIGSTENLTERPKREVAELLKLYYHFLSRLEKEEEPVLEKYQVKVRFIGDIEKLPLPLKNLMKEIMHKTAKYQKRALNILVNYGGKYELLEVFKKMAEKAVELGMIEVTEKEIEENLMVKTPVDLIIRTGGQSRLSNFMLWQSSYAEIYVTKTLFPDFSKKEFKKALSWFDSTTRNFGT